MRTIFPSSLPGGLWPVEAHYSVVISDFDPFRAVFSPDKAHAKLIVDPSAVLAPPIIFERLQAIPRGNPQ